MGSHMKSITRMSAWLFAALIAAMATSVLANAETLTLDRDVERALLAEQWADVAQRISSGGASDARRFLLGHAYLATNRNNEAVTAFRDTSAPQTVAGWRTWTSEFASTHPQSAVAKYLYGDALARDG